jgi:hypothetical protein
MKKATFIRVDIPKGWEISKPLDIRQRINDSVLIFYVHLRRKVSSITKDLKK